MQFLVSAIARSFFREGEKAADDGTGKVLGKNLVEWAAQSLYKLTIPKLAILNHTRPCNMPVEKFWVKIGRKAFISTPYQACNTKPYQAMQYVGGKVLGKNWAQSLYK